MDNPRITPYQDMSNLDKPATDEYLKVLQLMHDGKSLREVSQAYASFMLARHGGNKFHAAKRLQVDRRSLQRWAKGEKGCRGLTRLVVQPLTVTPA